MNDHNADECKRFAGEREAFEAEILESRPEADMSKKADGSYFNYYLECMWQGYMMRAAQPAPVVPEGWRDQLLREYPNADPDYWPESLIVNAQSREIADWRKLAAAPAQGQQVDWRKTAVMLEQANAGLAQLNGKLRAELAALKAQQAEQKPLIWCLQHKDRPELAALSACDSEEGCQKLAGHYGRDFVTVTPLYTAPQPAPAQDVAGLVEALERASGYIRSLTTPQGHAEVYTKIMNATGVLVQIAEALTAHDKQSGGDV